MPGHEPRARWMYKLLGICSDTDADGNVLDARVQPMPFGGQVTSPTSAGTMPRTSIDLR